MRKKFLIFVSFICFFIWSSAALAIDLVTSPDFSLTLKGYYKNLAFTSKRIATDDPYFAELSRLRTEWDARFLKNFSAKVVWDNEIIAGNYVNTEEFAARQAQRNVPYLNMDYDIVRRRNFFYGQDFYRAYVQYKTEPVVFTLGRQKIDWGVMRLFSPVDLFTRLPIFDVEREERVGTTAANLAVSLNGGWKINPVYSIHPDWDQSRIGGRITKTLGHFDVSALGGRFLKDQIYGFDFSGDIEKAGIRGEFVYDHTDFTKDFVQAAGGFDYGFENSLYVALEYFYNGQGGMKPPITAFPMGTPSVPLPTSSFFPLGIQIQTSRKNFLGLQSKYDFTPLWTISSMIIVDLNGGSLFWNPQTQYSFLSWLETSIGAHFPIGKSGGEFTKIPNLFYLQTQLFF